MRTSNPMMKESVFTQTITGAATMTLQGAVNKTVALLALVVIGASYSWNLFYNQGPEAVQPWMIGGLVGGFVFAMMTIFKANWAPKTAPIYAVLEGLALGGISAFFEARFPGIVIQAVGLTFGTLFALLFAYKARLIRATENFKLGVFAATGGIAVVYLISFVGRMFGWQMPVIHESGPMGILFSLFVVVVAALNLVLDFDFIERGDGVAPRYMEWYAAFGLILTLVWLYLELLRLLSKLRER
ncbi:MAG: Bax inhibitor-1/YccA family protein [Desulfuromonadales bacterium]